MQNVARPAPFVMVSSNHGTMIVNRNDYRMVDERNGYGVGFQILNSSCFDQPEVDLALLMLKQRRFHFGDGVVALDCGANIGVHTVEWARAMHGWGSVIAFEAQERVYYALAGNIALNNCLNATARLAALGAAPGTLRIPAPNYLVPSSFGSLELRRREGTEYIGQDIDYSESAGQPVEMVSIDSLALPRVDFLKIDVEGMEMQVIGGLSRTIAACRPPIFVEVEHENLPALSAWAEAQRYSIAAEGRQFRHNGNLLLLPDGSDASQSN